MSLKYIQLYMQVRPYEFEVNYLAVVTLEMLDLERENSLICRREFKSLVSLTI